MENKTKIIIETDAGRSEQILQSVKKGMQEFGNETEKTALKTKNSGNAISSALGDISSDLLKTTATAAGLGIAFKSAFDLAKDASTLSEARLYLQVFAAEIGVSFEKLEVASKKASANLVDDLTLIRQNHKALKLGISTDVNEIARIWEISNAVGDELGQSMEQTFEQITRAISEGNGKALLSLGLLPASFKRASDAGTLLERRAELLKTVLEQAGTGADSLGKYGDTSADKFDRFTASTTNLKKSLGEALLPIVTPIVEGLTAIADATGDVINKFAQLADISGPQNPFLGKTLEELQEMRNAAANRVGAAQANLSALTDPSQSYRRANESDITTKIMSSEIQYQGELAILKQIDSAMEKLQKRVEARKETEEKTLKAVADNAAKEADAAEKKKLAGEAEKKLKKELEDAQARLTKSIEATEKAATEASTAFLNGFGIKIVTNLKDAQALLLGATAAAGGFAVGLKNGTTEAGEMYEKLKKIDEYTENWLSMRRNGGYNAANDLRNFTPDAAMMGMLNFTAAGMFTAKGGKDPIKDIKEPLAKTIAEAVQAGFANVDFSDLALTFGSILSSVISKSVSQSSPVLNASGSVNWGNLGTNIAANWAIGKLTGAGGLFGARKENGKESIQQAATLREQMGQAYTKSYETSNLAYLYSGNGSSYLNSLSSGRAGYFGTQVGYSYNDSGNGIWSAKTRTYSMIDQGASSALKTLTDAIKNAEKYNRSVEMGYELMTAQGKEFQALLEQSKAYKNAANYVSSDVRQLTWTDGTRDEIDLSESAHEIKLAAAELARQLGQAKGERSDTIAQGFAKYSPWLNSIQMPDAISTGLRIAMRDFAGLNKTTANMASLNTSQQYDAFSALQTNYMDRNISPYLLDMIKQTGSSMYDLESLKIIDANSYAEKYAEYVEKQVQAFEEVMKRQEQIFLDASKTFEERSAALQTFENTQEAYYQAKLNSLAAEQAAEEAIKAKELESAARSRDRIASALNIYGEIAQAGTKIYVLTGGNRDVAYAELIKQNADNPAVVSALKSAETHNQGMVLWGEK